MVSLSKEEKLDIISNMMISHPTLCPKLFDKQNQLRAEISTKINDVVGFIKDQALSCFPNIIIKDITLNGSLCSYMYNDNSDLDLWIIVEPVFPNDRELSRNILRHIYKQLNLLAVAPSFYGHPLDFAILLDDAKFVHDYNCYSWLNKKWKIEPIRQEFSFTPQELYREFCIYNKKLHDYAASLEKINNSFLTRETVKLLEQHIFQLNNQAYQAKLYSPEHEYSLEYNLFRLLKKFGIWSFFRSYIHDSYQNVLRREHE